MQKGQEWAVQYTRSENFLIWSFRGHIHNQEKYGQELIKITENAYEEILQTMKKHRMENFVRIGNYVAQILQETVDLPPKGNGETPNRYEAFCEWRARALKNHQIGNPDLPAATGIGNYHPDPLQIFFIASNLERNHIQHHRNPLQKDPFEYNQNKYGLTLPGDGRPRFNRSTTLVTEKQSTIFISGTAAVGGKHDRGWEDVLHENNIQQQTRTTLENMRGTMEEAEKNTGEKFIDKALDIKIYIKHKEDAETVLEIIKTQDILKIRNIAMLQGDVCRAGRIVEISGETVE